MWDVAHLNVYLDSGHYSLAAACRATARRGQGRPRYV